MSSGAKLVLAMLGATLAIALVAVAAFLLTDEAAVRCAEGDLQDNEVGVAGRFLPRTETFATIAEAEAFVCRRFPHPREPGPFVLSSVEVERTTNLGELIEGNGRAIIRLAYTRDASSDLAATYEVAFPSLGEPEYGTAFEEVTVAGHEAGLEYTAKGTAVFWTADGFDYFAELIQEDSTDLEPLFTLLESVR